MSHEFGNIDSWTKHKLEKVSAYLDAYLIALKNQNFQLEYIDAFAGSGYVNRKGMMAGETLFDSHEDVSLRDFIDGSARLALRKEPPFDRYTFIEKHRARFAQLDLLKSEFPNRTIMTIRGDANQEVQKLCTRDWIGERRRGVMFLDPYGTQVTWDTVGMIAETQAIDLFVLFPIGTVNRLLNRDGRIIEPRKRRLECLFGEEAWFDQIYRAVDSPKLFSSDDKRYRKVADPFDTIANYFVRRLETIFPAVATNPLIMRNSTNSPIFLLCFAAGNRKGGPIAVRIAQHILQR